MTIDERAYAYADDDMNEEYASGKAVGYIAGATEQKKMDIDKACDWVREYTTRIRNVKMDRGEFTFQLMHPVQVDEMLAEFRKAMEEQL